MKKESRKWMKYPEIVWRKMLHPLLVTGLKGFEKLQFDTIGEDLETKLGDYEGPVLYAINHSNVHDFPMTCKVLKKHVYVLVANDIDNGKFNNFMLNLNGVIFVNRGDKTSCRLAKERIIELLRKGQSVVMFPEASWNLDDVKLLHDFKWGIIDIARVADVPIVPIGLKYNVSDKCRVKYGDMINVSKDDDLFTKKEELHEAMSTLIWDIIESFPTRNREEYEEIKEGYYAYVDKSLSEFAYEPEYERQFIYNSELYPFEIVGPTYDKNNPKVHARKRKR